MKDIPGKIVLVRIDNRLVHGQVGGPWSASLNVNVLIVIDDDVAKDTLQQRLMEFVASSNNIRIRFFTAEEFAEAVQETKSYTKMFLVVRNAQTVAKLVALGLPIKTVNLGNMHYEKGKIPLSHKVYVNEDDAKALQYLLDEDVKCFVQDVPGALREDITSLAHLDFKK